MKRPHPALLILTGVLFLAWIGYLAYQAFTLPRPNIVLSRPQFLVADLWVIAHIEKTDEPITVRECVWAAEGEEKLAKDATENWEKPLKVANLADCKTVIRTSKNELETHDDFTGPGDYILPLRRKSSGYFVTTVPPGPGQAPVGPHLYPDTQTTRKRLAEMPHPETTKK